MLEAYFYSEGCTRDYAPSAAITGGQVVQLANGMAAVANRDIDAGRLGAVATSGIFQVLKTSGIVILDGGKVYWDFSANAAHFKPQGDRDFYIGTAVGDSASADTQMYVDLNALGRYLVDLAEKPWASVPVGTQALGAFGYPYRRGGAQGILVSATNEAQKADMLGSDGFVVAAGPIVEMRINVLSIGAAAAPDFNVGLASATHATDADQIANHLFLHCDGNSSNINFQSKTPATTVGAEDSTVDLVAGTPFEVWFDCRNPADVQVYIDGVNVLPASVFDVSGANATLYLLSHLEKTAATDTYSAQVDWLRSRISGA